VSRARLIGRLLVVAALGIPLFGWIDLTGTWSLGGDTTAWDVAYGGLTGIVLPAAFLWGSALQAYAGAAGYAVAGIAGGQARYLLVAAAVATAAFLLLRGRERRAATPRPVLVGLALLATPGFVLLAVHATRKERLHLTAEAHAGLHAWAGVAAFAVAALLVAWLAANGVRQRLAGWSVALAVAYVGVASVILPHAAASVGTILGLLAIAWSITFVVAVERQ
jgi:hypothetical protein